MTKAATDKSIVSVTNEVYNSASNMYSVSTSKITSTGTKLNCTINVCMKWIHN